jgi:hypothetical protein
MRALVVFTEVRQVFCTMEPEVLAGANSGKQLHWLQLGGGRREVVYGGAPGEVAGCVHLLRLDRCSNSSRSSCGACCSEELGSDDVRWMTMSGTTARVRQ